MQVGIAPQELLFLSVGGATNGGTCCDSDSHHAGIAEQCLARANFSPRLPISESSLPLFIICLMAAIGV